MTDSSLTALCTYRVKPGKEAEFEALLRRHWPTLLDLGLVTDAPPPAFKGKEKSGACCESRDGCPSMKFPDVEPLALHA